jgi:hypothetical protein
MVHFWIGAKERQPEAGLSLEGAMTGSAAAAGFAKKRLNVPDETGCSSLTVRSPAQVGPRGFGFLLRAVACRGRNECQTENYS